jgi:lipopolysaccharide/colanic/teichoic acid biosynthesis glycosyltransferase
MSKLTGIDYLVSDEKKERDAKLAARLLKTTNWMVRPARRLLARELGVAYEDTLLYQERVVIGGGKVTIPKLVTLSTEGNNHHDPSLEDIRGTHDPRAGRVGRWARRLGLDEQPQLELAARGEMWVVGMRPLLARDVAAYEEADPDLYDQWQTLGRQARPLAGLTGLSQLYRRRHLGLPGGEERRRTMQLDIEWMTHASAELDRSIVRRTPYDLIVASLIQRIVQPPPTTPQP